MCDGGKTENNVTGRLQEKKKNVANRQKIVKLFRGITVMFFKLAYVISENNNLTVRYKNNIYFYNEGLEKGLTAAGRELEIK